MAKFKVGDVVRLTCGGPTMTITAEDVPREEPVNGSWSYGFPDSYRPDHWHVVWFNQRASKSDRFPGKALRLVDAPPESDGAEPPDQPNPRLRAVKGGA